MTRLIKLYVGLNDKDTKTQRYSSEYHMAQVRGIVFGNGIDCTLYNAQGVYTHHDGTIIKENTIVIEILDFGQADFNNAIKNLADELKTILNQESIGYSVITLDECELL